MEYDCDSSSSQEQKCNCYEGCGCLFGGTCMCREGRCECVKTCKCSKKTYYCVNKTYKNLAVNETKK